VRIAAAVVALAACGGGGGQRDHDATGHVPDAEPGPAAELHRIGRFDGDRFAWPGTTIRARFSGTELSVELGDSGQNQFDVWIDGQAQPVLAPGSGVATYPLAAGLADGEHEVVLARRTESFFGISEFRGFPGATLVPSAGRGRLVEFIGDSITCGYGVLGAEATCPFGADTEAETHAWGALAAAELGADHVAIAYSGKGVYRNYGGEGGDTMPDLFTRVFADDPRSTWGFAYTPDVVVINLGTNDFSVGDPGQPFVDAYRGLVADVRARYPDAWILIAESPMIDGTDRFVLRGHLDDVVAGSGERVALVEIAAQVATDGYGCDYHPSETTQQKMATALVARVRELAGW
jgi:lysophospholipase L1-like esterase